MVMIKRVLALLGSGTLAILLLRQAETAAQAVRDGVQLCLTSVVPALFPFFAVSSLLVALGAAEAAGAPIRSTPKPPTCRHSRRSAAMQPKSRNSPPMQESPSRS